MRRAGCKEESRVRLGFEDTKSFSFNQLKTKKFFFF